MAVTLNKATDQEKLAAFQKYDCWVFDLDGTSAGVCCIPEQQLLYKSICCVAWYDWKFFLVDSFS